MLAARKITLRAGGHTLLRGVDLELHPGQLHVVLGPNGAGKSSLLRTLAAELVPEAGQVELDGLALGQWPSLELARRRAVLPQRHALSFGFTASQVVELGRLPCVRRAPAAEAAIIRACLERAGIAALAARRYPTLSGGEQARVQLARVLAQLAEPSGPAPRFLLLDEPTASLDLAHQHGCLRLLRELAGEGVGILLVVHDPNLALRYADSVTLLQDGQVTAAGAPRDVLSAARLEQVYGVTVRLLAGPDAPVVVVS